MAKINSTTTLCKLLLFSLCLFQVTSAVEVIHKDESTPKFPDLLPGDDLIFEYKRSSSQEYYMSNHTASHTFYLFNIRNESSGYTFHWPEGSGYLKVDTSTKQLTYTRTGGDRSYFTILPLSEPNQFQILFNDEPLVSYQAVPPIQFYLQSKFPTEPPAIFYVTRELDVERGYGGRRENIIRSAKFIHNHVQDIENKTTGYQLLLSMMANSYHITGTEIFAVGHYMWRDLGDDSPTFNMLPKQVQLLSRDGTITWIYSRLSGPNIGNYTMKYVAASNIHENVLPYRFTFNTTDLTWAITYGGVHQLNINGNNEIVEQVSGTLVFKFRLSLLNEAFSIRTLASSNNVISSRDTAPDFHFVQSSTSSTFYVEEFMDSNG